MNMAVKTSALVAVPAIAQAAPALPVDPIFAAIERHRAEAKAYDEAIRHQDEIEESLRGEIRRNPRVQYGWKDGEPFYLYSHEHIEQKLEWMPDFARTPKIRARLHAEFDLDAKEQFVKQRECGLTAAELRTEKLCYSSHDLAWEMATTVPTSVAGVLAVLRYANEWEDAEQEWPSSDTGANGWHYQLRQTLAEALARIAA